jgi:hypothetical protein
MLSISSPVYVENNVKIQLPIHFATWWNIDESTHYTYDQQNAILLLLP